MRHPRIIIASIGLVAVGTTAQSLNITPGGLGVAEGSLSLALVATRLGTSQALAAVQSTELTLRTTELADNAGRPELAERRAAPGRG